MDPPPPETDHLSPLEVEAMVGLLRYKAATLKVELGQEELKAPGRNEERRNLTRTLEQVENAIHTLNTQLSVLLSLEQDPPEKDLPAYYRTITVGERVFYHVGTRPQVQERAGALEKEHGVQAFISTFGLARHPDPGGTIADQPCNGDDAAFLEGYCVICGWPFPTHTKSPQ